jgi:hypothetical protein
MKKLLVIGIILATVFCANALTFRQLASMNKGGNTTTDTVNVTYAERVQALHEIMSAKASRGVAQYIRTDYTNYTSFDSLQFKTFYDRGSTSELGNRVRNYMSSSSIVDVNGLNASDAQLETAYKNVMFALIRLIGTGAL